MARYRIKKEEVFGNVFFCLQKKSFFGMWYNPDNIDGEITGIYDSLQEVKDAYKRKTAKTKITIVDID